MTTILAEPRQLELQAPHLARLLDEQLEPASVEDPHRGDGPAREDLEKHGSPASAERDGAATGGGGGEERVGEGHAAPSTRRGQKLRRAVRKGGASVEA
jgi:hypothetical protein